MISKDGCQASVPPFSGRTGFYIKGSVLPPLSGVHVRVLAAGDSQTAQLKNGDLVLETTTETDGSFLGGPLYDDIDYSVDASKVRYYDSLFGLIAASMMIALDRLFG